MKQKAVYELVRTACQPSVMGTAFRVALFVGTILNVINQGGRVLDGVPLSWFHVALNYLVPYCVSSYSAARSDIRYDKERNEP